MKINEAMDNFFGNSNFFAMQLEKIKKECSLVTEIDKDSFNNYFRFLNKNYDIKLKVNIAEESREENFHIKKVKEGLFK